MRIDPIVTGHAVRPEGQDMFRGKSLVIPQMAVGTNILVKRRGIIFYMAILADKGCAI